MAGTACKVDIPSEWLAQFCRRNHIYRLSLFGSVLRDDFHEGSDLDVLVEYEPDARVGYLALIRMQEELSEKLGITVDLRTPAGLSRYIRQKVLDEAEVKYVHR